MTSTRMSVPRPARVLGVLAACTAVSLLLVGCKPGAGPAPSAGGASSSPSTAPTTAAPPVSPTSAPNGSTAPSPTSSTPPSSTVSGSSSSTPSAGEVAPSAPATEPSGPAPRTCRITIAYGPGDATAGPSYRPVVFTNTGQQPCQLTGGAHAEFLTPDGTGVVGDSTAIAGGPGILGPGASITSTMRSTSTGKFDEERCGAVPVSGLRITPPADAEPTNLPSTVGDTVCNGIIRGQISFTPLPTGP